jgi:hypothetical protein
MVVFSHHIDPPLADGSLFVAASLDLRHFGFKERNGYAHTLNAPSPALLLMIQNAQSSIIVTEVKERPLRRRCCHSGEWRFRYLVARGNGPAALQEKTPKRT